MRSFIRTGRLAQVVAATAALGLLGMSLSDSPAQEPASGLTQPVYRVSNAETETEGAVKDASPAPTEDDPTIVQTAGQQPEPAPEHPLMPALRIAHAGLSRIDEKIEDYSCTLVKRERINGKLGDSEYIFLKVRHQPFSVYMYFLAPNSVKGRECIFVESQNEGKLIAHEGTGLTQVLGTVRLDPEGTLAMRGQKYPITEVGVRTLASRLIEVANNDLKYQECEVKFFKGAKIDDRSATVIQVEHPVPRKEFRFNLARVFVDDELQIPIRYEAYQWPDKPGGQPVLDEEYTYLKLKINNGFTDEDFSESNKNYSF